MGDPRKNNEITGYKELKEQNQKLEKLLKASEQEKENDAKFWAQISREMRNSLNAIMGMSNFWKTEIYDIDNVKEGFEKIQECSQTLLGITNGIIDYTTIENQSVSLKENNMNLKDIINDLASLTYERAKEQTKNFNIYIQSVIDEEVIGDEFRVHQILQYVLNEMLKITPKQGKMDFSLRQISSSGGNAYMRFSFKISGENIDKNKLNKYAACVEKDKDNFKWSYEGNDINLYICTYFIQLMNGNVMLKHLSDTEYELIVDFEFKRIKKTENEEQYAFCRKNRVLIVGDDNIVNEARGKTLAEMGIDYDYATNEEDALDKIGEADNAKKPYGICIIDWTSEKISVRNLIADIRNIFGREIVIVATTYDKNSCVKEAKRMGVNYLIEQAWFRSTIYDAMVNIEHGQISQIADEIMIERKYDFSGRNILIAEDMQLNMEVNVNLLTRAKAQVYCANNGVEAVQMFVNNPEEFFDCILMDINMPIMDGYEATKKIRNSKKTDSKSVPIYAMTANAFAQDIVEALDAGMNGHIAKPVEFDVLFNTLEKVFSESDEKKAQKELILEQVAEFEAKNEKLKKQNKELRIKAERDSLTKLFNRYGFEKIVDKLVKTNECIGLLLVDLDHFKLINDKYGHEIGDKALIKVADILRKKFRTTDDVIRLGGDEFAVVLKDFSDDKNFAVRKIVEINEELKKTTDEVPAFTVSAGAAFSESGYKKELYKLADKALYTVKNKERGGCIISTENVLDVLWEKENMPWNKSWYDEEIIYASDDNGAILEDSKSYIDILLNDSKAVGIVSGYYTEGLPIYSISSFMLKNLGYTYDEFVENTEGLLADIVYADDLCSIQEDIGMDKISHKNVRMICKNGEIIWFEKTQLTIRASNSKKIWLASFRYIDDCVTGAYCDNDYQVVSMIYCKQDMIVFEKGAQRIKGYELELRKKYNYSSLIDIINKNNIRKEEQDEFAYNARISNLKQKIKALGFYEFISYGMKLDGTYGAIRFKTRYFDEKNEIILCTQELVERWAEYDDLTGLMNEHGFYRNVAKLILDKQDNTEYAILYFNIKGFKAWNEMLGYNGANILLKRVAERLEKSNMMPVMAARFFADNFVCLVDRTKINYDEITKICNSKEEIDVNRINMRMHCGIYNIEDKIHDVRYMCDRAKLAKAHITNEFAVPYAEFESGMDDEYLNELYVLNNLERALKNNEFKVYYQPVFDTKTKEIVSAEALIRWELPGKKVISPGVFVPVLETKGYITELDYFVESNTQKFLEMRAQNNKKYVPVSMNLSRMDLINEKFINSLKENVDSTTINHKYLRFEVTESSYVEVGSRGVDLISELRKNGSKILIDDFGTGSSSLENLLNLECDIVKLDKVFIKNIGKNAVSEEIIRSVIMACHKTGIYVIAEGVETQEQYEFMCNADCDYIQGFYFSKPLSQEDFAKLLDENN